MFALLGYDMQSIVCVSTGIASGGFKSFNHALISPQDPTIFKGTFGTALSPLVTHQAPG